MRPRSSEKSEAVIRRQEIHRLNEIQRQNETEQERQDTPKELVVGMWRVFMATLHGANPRQCAVMYRSLASTFPRFSGMLLRYANKWEDLGENWNPHQPNPGNVGESMAKASWAEVLR
jgi:hypothetical protein